MHASGETRGADRLESLVCPLAGILEGLFGHDLEDLLGGLIGEAGIGKDLIGVVEFAGGFESTSENHTTSSGAALNA